MQDIKPSSSPGCFSVENTRYGQQNNMIFLLQRPSHVTFSWRCHQECSLKFFSFECVIVIDWCCCSAFNTPSVFMKWWTSEQTSFVRFRQTPSHTRNNFNALNFCALSIFIIMARTQKRPLVEAAEESTQHAALQRAPSAFCEVAWVILIKTRAFSNSSHSSQNI